MKIIGALILLVGAMLLSPFATDAAMAQATRTWVSGVGDDANPCSRTAPCKTFAGALPKTAPGGEIDVLDSGGFGSVTINKSLALRADGVTGGVLVASTDAITINAGPSDVIVLAGLDIEGLGMTQAYGGLSGVKVVSAGKVSIQNCTIRGFKTAGLHLAATTAVDVSIEDSQIFNSSVGILAIGSNAAARVSANRVNLAGNPIGVQATGGPAQVTMSNSFINGSPQALRATYNGKILSYGNNTLSNNNPAYETFTGTVMLK